ncbi:hypothetical protein D1632_06710 [Chryseobacterium nematophagum]|uniref:Uncharacterized protein n=1 Tax=Chryseobacterium nematophagum TaxID=2305228 RepID=A0A3M7LAU8_9FLAO|nr:hypothetical protein [Chryseobacterium nematophagum]RMZ59329.1 hypothetical protein D1632_06710 [Chryseobacterium nematophagum]
MKLTRHNNIKKLLFIVPVVIGSYFNAQVRIADSNANSSAANSSAFIDASSNPAFNLSPEKGKGLLYPRTDLTLFTTFGGQTPFGIPNNYPNFYDGFMVFNTATSGQAGVGTTEGGVLTAGYWYYDNKSGTINGGTWKPVGGSGASPKVDILTTETMTNTLVNSAQVFAIKGSFTATGASTAVNIPAPTGMTSLYSITIYKAGTGTVFSRDLYSYDLVATPGNAITGSPTMSIVYPSGTYDYVLEYLK